MRRKYLRVFPSFLITNEILPNDQLEDVPDIELLLNLL